jgi:hypothetical protein
MLNTSSLTPRHMPPSRRPLAAAWFAALVITLLAFALQPPTAGATSANAAAAPTFTSPCFTSANIQQSGTYTVPASGVSVVRAVLHGQNGAGGAGPFSGAGGRGATLVAQVPVTPGQILQFGTIVGGRGGAGAGAVAINTTTYEGYSGGNGGDAQYVSTVGADGCQHALAVAGGGGGGGGHGGAGGGAGTPAPASGGANGGNNNAVDGGGGGGGTATGGGSGGASGSDFFGSCHDGNAGSWGGFLSGGKGGDTPALMSSGNCYFPYHGGGGGGGGYYGGGGGGSPYGGGWAGDSIGSINYTGGGGGGASYSDPSVTTLSVTSGATTEGALVVPDLATATTLTTSLNPSVYGDTVTITARVTAAFSGQPVPSGAVLIRTGTTSTTVAIGTNGEASITTAALPVGTYPLGATFLDTVTATAAYRTSVSTDVQQLVHPCAPAPTFPQQPAATTATLGTTVTLSAVVSNPPIYGSLPTVVWQTSTDGGTTWVTVTGTDTSGGAAAPDTAVAALDVVVDLPPGVQQFRALATTCGGTTTSDAATLTVRGIVFSLTSLPAKTYGNAPFDVASYATGSSVAVGFTSVTPTVCTVTGSTVTLVGAGTCTIAADESGTTANYTTAPQVRQSFAVGKKTITVLAGSPPSQPQGSPTLPTVTCTSSGLVGTDTFVGAPLGSVGLIDPTGVFRPRTSPETLTAGTYRTRCKDVDAGASYIIGGYTYGTFVVTAPLPPTLTITANNTSYTYGTTPPTLDATYSSSSIAHSGTLSCSAYATSDTAYASPLTLATTTPVVMGGYTIRCSGITSPNPVAWANGTLTVNPASVSVTASSPTGQTYGTAAAPSVACTATGFVGADGFATAPASAVYDPTGTSQATIDATADAGTYVTVCAGGDPGGNYTIGGYTPGTFTVAPAALTVTPDADQSMPYGSTAMPALSFRLAGFKNGQQGGVLTQQPRCTPAATAYDGTMVGSGSPVGTYAITCAGGQAANYTFSDNAGDTRFAVTPVGLTITPDTKSITAGGTMPTLTWRAADLANGDTAENAFVAPNTPPTCSTTARANRLGSYPISCAGAANPNYAIGYAASTFNVNADGAAQLAIVAGSPQSAAVTTAYATPFQVVVRDQYGNPVADGTVATFTAPASGATGTFAGTGTTTATATTTNGIATAPIFTANGVAGAFAVQVAAGGGVLPLSLTNTPGPVARLAMVASPTATTVGAAVGLTVTAQDAQGNPVPTYADTVHFTSTDPQATLPADYTFAAGDGGAHTFGATLATAGNQTITATDTVNAAVTGGATVAVSAATPATLTATGGTPQSRAIGQAFGALTARVVDSYGNPVPGVAVTFAAPASGASATFPGGAASATVATGPDGVATAPIATANGTAGGYTVVASGAGGSATFALTNTPGPATRLVASGLAGSVQAGTPVTFAVTALDAGGNVATGYTGTLHLTSGDAAATLPADYTFAAGDAGTHQFTATLQTGGARTITATDTLNGALTTSATTQVVVPATPAGASVTPSSLPFGTRQVGTTSDSQQVTVTNTGGSNLNIGGVTLGGANAEQFNLAYNNCVGAIAPQAACTIGVRFAPTAAQPSSATLQIADDAAGSPQTVALNGTGTATPQPSPAAASVSPSSVPFPTTQVGQRANAQQVTVANTGGSPLHVFNVTLVGTAADQFVLEYNTCTGNVQADSSCVIGVRFAPTVAQASSATLQIADDAAGSPQTVALSGTGTNLPTPQSVVTASVRGGGTVTPAGATSYPTGSTAIYTAAPAAGQVFLGWTLDGQYVGYATPLTVTVNTNRTLVATFAARPTFSDVPTSDPDYQAITTLAALGIINPAGVNGSGQFQSGRAVARAEVAAFLARTFGWEAEFHGNPFPDKCDPTGQGCVDDRLWNDVAALRDYGVVGGYTDAATCQALGTTAPCYGPRESVLKVQVVSIVARAFTKAPDLRPTGFWDRLASVASQYTNVPDAGSQRSDLTTYRANAGAIPGQASDGTFPAPTDPATRRFVIQVLWQAYGAQFGTDRVP